MHGSLQKENEDPKKPFGPKVYNFTQRTKNCGNETRGLGLGAVNCRIMTIKYMA